MNTDERSKESRNAEVTPESGFEPRVICCPHCGGDDIAAGDQKADGTERKCRECGLQFLR